MSDISVFCGIHPIRARGEMAGLIRAVCIPFLALLAFGTRDTNGEIPSDVQHTINCINKNGPYVGVVIPNAFEMNPLLQSPSFSPRKTQPHIDYAGRRFRFGTVEGKKVILVMSGLGMINAGITTQLLLGLFKIEGVVHYGIAGNANPSLMIGDVTVPRYWAHSALWSWQRNGDGPNDELPLEASGDYTRDVGFLKFSDYTTDGEAIDNRHGNLLNNVWYQPEEVFPVDGTPEQRQHAFWVPVNPRYFALSKKLEGLKLQRCINSTTCLSRDPAVFRVSRGMSASIYLDNAAYRTFLYEKFRLSPVEMEGASVALVCHQQRVPFIIVRALSDVAGGGSAQSNEAATFISLAAANSVTAVVEFIKLL